MKNLSSAFVLFAYCLGLSLSPISASAHGAEPPPGFRALFNGHNLAGWWGAATEDPREYLNLSESEFEAKVAASLPDIEAHWSVEHGELVNGGEGLYLTTLENFGDYELLLEYRTVAGADSGIYLKGSPQVQIWDTTEAGGKWDRGADKGSGGLWNNSPGQPGKDPLVVADRDFGAWNQFRIIQCGARTWVWLNEQLVVDGAILENYFDEKRNLPIPAAGPIQLQTHGGEIRWRNIFIREIDTAEANRRLRARANDGFETIFNGRDFTGWTGATDGYTAGSGVIAAKADQGGTLYTEAEYANFMVRLDFKLPPRGNNGLAIRYPGHGNPAYDAMTEIQVLDNPHVDYAALDARQYHGSVYGMVPAHRGYLRPVGQWNFQEVTVDGSRIRVELNGNIILDADVSEATDFFQDKPHPGRGLTKGHFGFAGHKSPVEFRQITLKRLR